MTNLKMSRSRGQALTERALLMLLLVVLVISSLAFVGASASGIFNGLNNAINGTTNSSPGPTTNPNPTGNTNGTLIISDSAPTLGQTITLTGSGFAPSTPVRAVMRSDPVVLKTQNCDTNGNITMEVYIPPTINLGDHIITLEGTNPSHAPITLSSPPLTIGPNPIVGTAQLASGPFFSGNYHAVLYSFSTDAAGGLGDLAYSWTGPDGLTSTDAAPSYTFTCSSLPGSVNLSVIDGMHHELRIGIPLPPCPEQINASASISDGPAYGDNYGTATYTLNSVASGGLAPLTAAWSGPAGWTSPDAAPTATFACAALPANVTYTVTDANGQAGHATLGLVACTSAMSVTPQLGSITYGGNYQNMTTTLDALISGGQNPYTYAWTGPGNFSSTETSPSFTVDCSALPGTISLTITDTAGKTAAGSLDLVSCTAALTGSPQIVSGPLYSGNYSTATYNFALSSGGGVGTLTYAWSGPDGFSSTSDTPYYTFSCAALPGAISLTTTDTAGKTNTDQLQIPACLHSLSVTPQAGARTYTNNYTATSIALSAAISGGQTPFTYAWSGPAGFSSVSATPSLTAACSALPQAIDLTINDTNGQSQSASLDLAACAGNLAVSATLTGVTYNGNYTSKSGTLASTISGGTSPFTYAWTGPGVYTASVANPGAVTFTCANLPGTATLTVTDANSQTASGSVSVPACPGSLTTSANITSGPLFGGNYSTVTYTFGTLTGGGVGAPSDAWSGPDGFSSTDTAPSYTFTCNALPGVVSLTVTDDNGKTATDTISLPACTSVVSVNISAGTRSYGSGYGDTTIALSASVSGGLSPYTAYAWSGPSGSTFSPASNDSAPSITIPCVSLTSGGNVDLSVTDTAGQVGSDTISITACPFSINASITKTSGPLYSGNYSTAAYVFAGAASGGTTPYTYAWSGPSGFSSTTQDSSYTFTCSDLVSGPDVTLTITDHNAKTASTTYTLPACSSNLDASVGAGVRTYSNNYTATTVALTSSVTGGNTPYTYGWTGPGGFSASTNNPSITVNCSLLPADVTLNLSDNNGQTQTASYNITACASNLTVSASLNSVTFNGNYVSKSGSLASTVSGGTTPYTYAWTGPGSYTSTVASPGSVTFTCTSLPGTATLTVTDANSQTASGSVAIAACPSGLTASASITTGPLYAGNYTSAAYIFNGSTTGGTGSPTYGWSGPDGFSSTDATPSYTFTCTALPGTVTLTVTDGNGKTATNTVSLPACTGGVSVNASAGTRSYGTGYTDTTIALSALVSGGLSPYTAYGWTGPTGATFSPSASSTAPSVTIPCSSLTSGGTITLNVTDTAGQVGAGTISVAACPVSINASIIKTSGPLYSGNYSTAAYAFNGGASGGTSPYTYAWSGPSGFSASTQNSSYTFTCADLTAGGTVTLTVTDHNAKTGSTTYSLPACTGALTAAIGHGAQTYTNNYTSTTLALTSTVGSGHTPYTYAWTGPGGFNASSANSSITVNCSLLPGDINLNVSDANGQNKAATYNMSACASNLVVSATLSAITFNGNYTSKSGSLASTVSGGTAPLTYAWTGPGSYTSSVANPGSVTFTCTNLPGTATLTVTDANSQTASGSVSISACPPGLNTSATVTSGPLYAGNYSTAAYIFSGSATGGAGTNTYAWSGPDGFSSTVAAPSYTFTCTALAGTVTLTVTDVNGIASNATINLTACNAVLAATTPTITSQTYSTNYTSTTISLSSTVTGGDSPTQTWLTTASGGTISWSGQTTTTPSVTIPCADLTGGAQTIKIRVNDAAGQTIDSSTLTIAACPSVMSLSPYAGTPTYTGNYVTKNVTLVSGLVGGSAAYTYAWTGTGGLAAFSSSVASPALAATCTALPATVNLTVTDANSQSVSSSVSISACTGAIVSTPAISSGPSYTGNYATALYGFVSSASGGSGALTYAWSGPDGFSASVANPSYTFTCTALPGVVTLIVTDAASKSLTNTLNLPACIGHLVTSASPGTRSYDTDYVHTTIPLTSTVSGGQTAYTYGWTGPSGSTFSPSSSSTTPTVTIPCASLSAGGSVVLNVTDAHGQVGTATVSVTPCPSQIFATITKNTGPLYAGNYSTAAYTFTASATGGAGSYTYAWTGPSGFSDTVTAPSYTFTCTDLTNGNQVVTLVATDTNNKTGAQTYPLAACASQMTANVPTLTSRTYDTNYTNTTLHLSSSVSGGNTTSYSWLTTATGGSINWTGATTLTPTVTLPCADLSSGTQTVKLRVTDASGQTIDSATLTIAACPANLALTPSAGTATYGGNYATKTVTLAAGLSGGTAAYTYAWTSTLPGFPSSATSPTISAVACTLLPATVNLTVTDGNSQTASGSVSITACPSGVSAGTLSLTAGPAYTDNYSTVTYTFASTASGGTAPLTYLWTAPDGSTSTAASPSMMINCAGWSGSNISLVVKDASLVSSTVATLALSACPPALLATTPTITSQTYSADFNTTTLVLSSTVTGGSGSKTYSWSTTATGGTITWTNGTTTAPTVVLPSIDLITGTQTVTIHVVDALGQTANVSVTIPAPPSAC